MAEVAEEVAPVVPDSAPATAAEPQDGVATGATNGSSTSAEQVSAPSGEQQAGQQAEQQAEQAKPPGEEVTFKVQFGKNSSEVKRPAESTVGELKALIEQQTGIPCKLQKLMCKGSALKEDEKTLKQAGVKAGSKLLLIGSGAAAVDEAKQGVAASGAGASWDEAAKQEEPLHKQTQHAKVLAKGVPDGALPGISGRQVTLDTKATPSIPALLNSQGTKVRLTFKEELQQLWIGSDTSTQKVPYSSVGKIEAFPIEGNDAYSILALHLGAGGTSKYWLYFFPSQYVAALKIRVLGVASLL